MKFLPKFNDITQNVNKIVGSQLQKFRTFQQESGVGFGLGLDFYPYPRKQILIASKSDWGFVDQESIKSLKNQTHPLELYVRAHLEGAKVTQVNVTQGVFDFQLGERGALKLQRDGNRLKALCEVPGRKPYSVEISLLEPVLGAGAEASAEGSSRFKKFQKMLEKIEGDLAEARDWLAQWGAICEKLEQDPLSWTGEDKWDGLQQKIITESIRNGDLPPLGVQNLGLAQKTLFSKRRRQLRRLEGATQRLQQVKNQSPEDYYQMRSGKVVAPKKGAAVHGPQKKPGLWIHLGQKLWVRLGRSASENDELFRQAKDRDLWFHVRGYAGAHIWVPRGQPELGQTTELSKIWVDVLCQLALFNSKLKNSGQGMVDYTERRYLKKVRGTLGQVLVQRSQSHHARLDQEFESRWLLK